MSASAQQAARPELLTCLSIIGQIQEQLRRLRNLHKAQGAYRRTVPHPFEKGKSLAGAALKTGVTVSRDRLIGITQTARLIRRMLPSLATVAREALPYVEAKHGKPLEALIESIDDLQIPNDTASPDRKCEAATGVSLWCHLSGPRLLKSAAKMLAKYAQTRDAAERQEGPPAAKPKTAASEPAPVLHPDDVKILQLLAKAGTTQFQYSLEAASGLSRKTISIRMAKLRKAGLTSRPNGARGGEAITNDGRTALANDGGQAAH